MEERNCRSEVADLLLRHKVPEELVLNLDQTPLGLTSASKVTFAPHGAKKVPISNIDDKRMITGSFCVSMKGDFIPIQLIYAGKTNRCHPKIKFPKRFHVTHTPIHWSNEKVHMKYLEKIVFPYVENVRSHESAGKIRKLRSSTTFSKGKQQVHKCITVNQPAKSFVSNKYQNWYADRVSDQLNRGVAPHDVKVDVKLSTVKPLHAQWVVDFYNNMQLASSKSIIKKGF